MPLYYQVEAIIDKRLNKKGKPEYKIKWKDYPFEECSWEPLSHLKNVMIMVKEFEQNHNKESSTSSTCDTFIKKKRNKSNSLKDINLEFINDKKVKKNFKNLKDIYPEEKYIKDTLLKKNSNTNFSNDFDIIDLEKIRNNYFAIIMNKIPYFYIPFLIILFFWGIMI